MPRDAKLWTFQSGIIDWFRANGRRLPWRETNNPFHILIAEVILRLTGAAKVEEAYRLLLAKYGMPTLMANANQDELLKIFKRLGLHQRATLLMDISKELNSRFSGSVPRTYAELTSLMGIGPYTANAILCLAYAKRVPMVDGRVARLFQRCFRCPIGSDISKDSRIWRFASELLPNSNCLEYNLGLVDVASLLCKRIKPRCNLCPVATMCQSETEQASLIPDDRVKKNSDINSGTHARDC